MKGMTDKDESGHIGREVWLWIQQNNIYDIEDIKCRQQKRFDMMGVALDEEGIIDE